MRRTPAGPPRFQARGLDLAAQALLNNGRPFPSVESAYRSFLLLRDDSKLVTQDPPRRRSAALVRHRGQPCRDRCDEQCAAEEKAGDQEQGDHRNPEADIWQGELGQQGDSSSAGLAEIPADMDRALKVGIHQRAAVKAGRRQGPSGFALWAVVWAEVIGIGYLSAVLLDRANEGVKD